MQFGSGGGGGGHCSSLSLDEEIALEWSEVVASGCAGVAATVRFCSWIEGGCVVGASAWWEVAAQGEAKEALQEVLLG